MPNHVSDVTLDFFSFLGDLHIHESGCDCTILINEVWIFFIQIITEHRGFHRAHSIQSIYTVQVTYKSPKDRIMQRLILTALCEAGDKKKKKN